MRGLLLATLVVSYSACMSLQPPEGDIIPPATLVFKPEGLDVPPESRISVDFTEPMDESVSALTLLLEASAADIYFLNDFDSPPLSKSRLSVPVPCSAELRQEGSRVLLTPEQSLESGTEYAVVVSAAACDRVGNPLVNQVSVDERGLVIGHQGHVLHTFTTRTQSGSDPDPGPDPEPVVGLLFTEIHANPEGPENQGEYVEVLNAGTAPVDLSFCRLDDQGGAGEGDPLRPCVGDGPSRLEPGAVALLVGLDFIPPTDLDPGARLLCADRASLTPRGLKNSGGEVLVLKDSLASEVCRYGGWLDLSSAEGCSATRLDLAAPDGPDNWSIPEEGCRTPGWIGD